MDSTGNLVAVLVELAAGVEGGEHDLRRRSVLRGVGVDGDAAAIVGHGDAVVVVDDDGDLPAEARQGLVDGIVDDFVDEVVEAIQAGRPDVHRRALPDRIEALQDLDGTRIVTH